MFIDGIQTIERDGLYGFKREDGTVFVEAKYKFVGEGKKIITQSPSAGSAIPTGGTVVLYTEKGEKKKVKVPDFTGLTISEANAAAADRNLNIEISGNNLSSSSVVAYSQSTEKGAEVDIGAVITVSFKSTKSVLD